MNQWVGVLGAEETLELGGVTPEHLRNFFGIEAGEASGQVFTAFGIDPDRIAGGKIAMYFERAGASSEARPPRIAWPAPASTTIVPRGSAAKRSTDGVRSRGP